MTVPFLLTVQQGAAARSLLHYAGSLPLAGADAQLLATVIAIRAARDEQGNITGQDMRSLRLTDPESALAALTALGWHFAGDLRGGDDEAPVTVTVSGLSSVLPISKTARSRVSGWTTRTLTAKPIRKTSPQARLAALFLAAYSSSDCYGTLPQDLPEHCLGALPELTSAGFLADLADDRYLLDVSVRHLSGLHPRSHDNMAIARLNWQAWKERASPALRRHAENVEHCTLCSIPLDQVASAFMRPATQMKVLPRVRTAYGAWKDTQPDRGPHAAEFAAAWRAEHGHGPSIRQLCSGLGWSAGPRELQVFIVRRLIANEWLTDTAPVPWTLRPGKAAQPRHPATALASAAR